MIQLGISMKHSALGAGNGKINFIHRWRSKIEP